MRETAIFRLGKQIKQLQAENNKLKNLLAESLNESYVIKLRTQITQLEKTLDNLEKNGIKRFLCPRIIEGFSYDGYLETIHRYIKQIAKDTLRDINH